MKGNHEGLQARWTHLYRDYLPALAKARDPVQKTWPVFLDHCFARIILDNAVGEDRPWMEVIKQPAVKNMSASQLEAAIGLAEKIATGNANLVDLNDKSLQMRGKKRKAVDTPATQAPKAKKERRSTGTISSYFLPSPSSPKREAPMPDEESTAIKPSAKTMNSDSDLMDMSVQLKRIADSSITPFRKRTLSLLCEIPRGRYSTYQAMSDYITKTSHKTCARAVGNAMRNNPFAPGVPCHRVLASDGSLGGFNGHWGEDGKFASEKHRLLYEEGIRFDSNNKVKGPPFREFRSCLWLPSSG
ncbi:hypothetical protein LTR37_006182 [Vermiconidia calcicola]|uniref:Uncharacterized protein n=1 Tax=Vermiconidia calcicola TaxID=1690605 RepID=A0ACC3NJW4_9PEZI|nr:hypothetical protein LTR37_006182 [Vermiconidia calcicola]